MNAEEMDERKSKFVRNGMDLVVVDLILLCVSSLSLCLVPPLLSSSGLFQHGTAFHFNEQVIVRLIAIARFLFVLVFVVLSSFLLHLSLLLVSCFFF